jgi:hypothetical protein
MLTIHSSKQTRFRDAKKTIGVDMNMSYFFKHPICFYLVAAFGAAVQVQPALAFEDEWRERRLETPIGMDGTSSGERAIGFRRDSDHRRIETNTIYGSTLATAIGNQINVEAAVGSSVVINANQYNTGHQLAVTVIGKDQDDIAKEAVNDFHDRN